MCIRDSFGYYPDFSAFDFLLYVSALKGLDEKAARKKSKELLEAVDLSLIHIFLQSTFELYEETLLLILCWLLQKNQTRAINF